MTSDGGYWSRGGRHRPDAGEYDEDSYDDQASYNGHGDPYQDSDSYQRPEWHEAQNGYGWSGGYGQPDEYSGSDRYGGTGGYADPQGYPDQRGYGDQGGYSDPQSYGGPGDYGARGYGEQSGYAGPGGYANQGGYSEPGGYGEQGGYVGSGYDQAGYGESGYAGGDGYGDQSGYGGGQASHGRHSADPLSSPGPGSHDPYGGGYGQPGGSGQYGAGPYQAEPGYGPGDPYGPGSYGREDRGADQAEAPNYQRQDQYGHTDPLTGSFRPDDTGGYSAADTGSHGSWAFTPGASGRGQDGPGYPPDAQGYDSAGRGPSPEPLPGRDGRDFAADSGSFGRPDSDAFARPDTGSFGRPDTGSFGRPDTGSFDAADSGTIGRPDTGSGGRADSGRVRRLHPGSFDRDNEFDGDGDHDPSQDTGSIRWTAGPPPLRTRADGDDDVPGRGSAAGDLAGRSGRRGDQAEDDWRDDDDGLLSRRFGQAGGMAEPATGGRGSGRGRKRRGRVRGKAASSVAIIAVMVVVAAAGFFGYRVVNKWITNRYGDYSGPGTGTVTITVQQHDTLTGLGPELVQKGVIMTLRPYNTAAAAASKPLLPGVYQLHRHMNSALAVQFLLSAKYRTQTKVLITEGTRASTIATQLAAATGYKASAFTDIIKNPAQLGLPSWAPKGVSAEGFLFPDTYTFQPKETPLEILKQMVQEFNQNVATIHLVSEAAKVFTTPYHALIVASMIQAEGGRVKDFPGISRVVWNRMKFHMRLQFDSTVFYAMGKHGTAITLQDEKFKSPYNTYLHTGLPPGPIGNPGVDAMQAAVHPVKAGYLYFITDTRHAPYVTYFATSLQKFNQLKQKYQG
ncbi:MAG: endolytic transglycosylase MltG [Streptosporangiaceae bacterium]